MLQLDTGTGRDKMIVHFIYHNQTARPLNKYFIYWLSYHQPSSLTLTGYMTSSVIGQIYFVNMKTNIQHKPRGFYAWPLRGLCRTGAKWRVSQQDQVWEPQQQQHPGAGWHYCHLSPMADFQLPCHTQVEDRNIFGGHCVTPNNNWTSLL